MSRMISSNHSQPHTKIKIIDAGRRRPLFTKVMTQGKREKKEKEKKTTKMTL